MSYRKEAQDHLELQREILEELRAIREELTRQRTSDRLNEELDLKK